MKKIKSDFKVYSTDFQPDILDTATAGDVELQKELMRLLLLDIEDIKALHLGSADDLRALAHRCKGQCASLGFVGPSRLMMEIQDLCERSEDLDSSSIQEHGMQIIRLMECSADILQKHVDNLS